MGSVPVNWGPSVLGEHTPVTAVLGGSAHESCPWQRASQPCHSKPAEEAAQSRAQSKSSKSHAQYIAVAACRAEATAPYDMLEGELRKVDLPGPHIYPALAARSTGRAGGL